MPQFKDGARESGEHLKSHKAIHAGLDKYDEFLKNALADTGKYNANTLREIMDGFREVLFRYVGSISRTITFASPLGCKGIASLLRDLLVDGV